MKKILPIALSLSVLTGCGDGCNSGNGLESDESFIDNIIPDFLEDPKVEIALKEFKGEINSVVGINPLLGETNVGKLVFKVDKGKTCNLKSVSIYGDDKVFNLNTESVTFDGNELTKTDRGFKWNGNKSLNGERKFDFSIKTYNYSPDTTAVEVARNNAYKFKIEPQYSNCKRGENKTSTLVFASSVYYEEIRFNNKTNFNREFDFVHSFTVNFQRNFNVSKKYGELISLDGSVMYLKYELSNHSNKPVTLAMTSFQSEGFEDLVLDAREVTEFYYFLDSDASDVLANDKTLSFFIYLRDANAEKDINIEVKPISFSFSADDSDALLHTIDFR